MRAHLAAQKLRVVQHGLVNALPHLYIGLPGRVNVKLGHACTGLLFQPKALHQPYRYLLARKADQVFKCLYDFRFMQFGAQFNGGSRIGTGLELLCLHQRSIKIEDYSQNHESTSLENRT